MSTLTFNGLVYDRPARARLPILSRLFDALVESRMRAADRELRRWEAVIGPDQLKEAGLSRLTLNDAGKLPFNG